MIPCLTKKTTWDGSIALRVSENSTGRLRALWAPWFWFSDPDTQHDVGTPYLSPTGPGWSCNIGKPGPEYICCPRKAERTQASIVKIKCLRIVKINTCENLNSTYSRKKGWVKRLKLANVLHANVSSPIHFLSSSAAALKLWKLWKPASYQPLKTAYQDWNFSKSLIPRVLSLWDLSDGHL